MEPYEVVRDLIQQLSSKAYYGVCGEKPLAMISAILYVKENNLYGKTLLEIFNEPFASGAKKVFIDLAKKFGKIQDPSASWSVITGKAKELQNAIIKFPLANESFARLSPEHMNKLLDVYLKLLKGKLEPTSSTASISTTVLLKETAPKIFAFKDADKILGSVLEEIKRIVSLCPRTHHAIVSSFRNSGWNTEVILLGAYRCDVYKNGTAIEVEAVDKTSVIDVLHRDLFRFLILYRMGKIRVGVLVTSLSGGEVNFEKAVKELELYGRFYEVPLLLIGVS